MWPQQTVIDIVHSNKKKLCAVCDDIESKPFQNSPNETVHQIDSDTVPIVVYESFSHILCETGIQRCAIVH